MSKRKREYKFYATSPGGGFSVYSVNYSRGTHRWIYTVYATSIRQAYYLAAHRVFAQAETDVGIRTLESDWWHDTDCHTNAEAEAAGHRTVAPYLRRVG